MKRPLTKTASILNIVLYSIYAVSCFISAIIFIDFMTWDPTFTLGLIMFISSLLFEAVSILQIVFGAKILKICSSSKQDFAKKKGIIVTSIVFTFILCLFIIIGLFAVHDSLSIVLNIILLGGFITSNIFLLIDLSKNKKLPDGDYVEQQSQYSDTSTIVNNNYGYAQQPTQQPSRQEFNSNTFEGKLSKLNLLKEQGILSENEFNSLKAKLIERELNK